VLKKPGFDTFAAERYACFGLPQKINNNRYLTRCYFRTFVLRRWQRWSFSAVIYQIEKWRHILSMPYCLIYVLNYPNWCFWSATICC